MRSCSVSYKCYGLPYEKIIEKVIIKDSIFRYVDAHRGISVQLGGEETDLKAAMDKSGLCTTATIERLPGQPSDDMYLKQAEHLMRKGVLAPALAYIDQAMKMNPDSKVISLAKHDI